MKKISVVVLLVFVFSLLSTSFFVSNAQTKIDTKSKSVILIECSTGKVLYKDNENEKLAPASVTKVMTMLLIMEALRDNKIKYSDMVTTSAHAASMGGSQIFLKEGEQLSVKDMLKSIAVASGNDAAVAMAEHIAGSEEEFVAKMNKRAKELGMKNTTFKNCCGLDTDGHLTTAKDISLMSRELLKYDDIKKFSTIWMDTIRNGEFGLTNTNKLVRFYKDATGLKTGSTGKALYCISASAKRNSMELCAVVMGGPTSNDRFEDAKKLLNYGFANYEIYNSKKQKFSPVEVKKGKEKSVEIMPKQTLSLLVKKGESDKIKEKVTLAENVTAPVDKNQKVGNVDFILDGKNISSVPIITKTAIARASFIDTFLKEIQLFLKV